MHSHAIHKSDLYDYEGALLIAGKYIVDAGYICLKCQHNNTNSAEIACACAYVDFLSCRGYDCSDPLCYTLERKYAALASGITNSR